MRLKDAFFRKKTSGNSARDRLKLVLVSDRANCSPDTLELMKKDMAEVISKYVEIGKQGIDIQILSPDYRHHNAAPAIRADIPIKELKTAR